MIEKVAAARPDAAGAAEESGATPPTSRPATTRGAELVTEHGKTSIADTVVAKIVGMAARDVPGVHAMGAGMARAFGTMRERLPGISGPGVTQGVVVEVGERQAAVDLDLIAEYGVSIPDLAAGVRRNVVAAVEKMCGLEVTEVNIIVGDIHLPGDEAEPTQEPRVQ
ncbi:MULTISPECIES: Asp23/Gls24 family envelope stress response protein [Actinomadura]|uniref:Asp23/Gls24 family envelope stress response protein n=1 Tax=Actinomadura miaoliensis TaxID=430685 RepID=A0ABP7W0N5_9ACTN